MRTAIQQSFLQTIPLFKNLAAGPRAEIGRDMKRQSFGAGEIIFAKDDDGAMLYFLESGRIRAYVSNAAGTETSVILCGSAGDFFGELAALDQKPRSATAVALTETVVWKLSCDDLFKHVQACPQLSINIIIELSSRVRYNTRRIHMFASKNIKQRLAETLVELAKTFGIVEPGKRAIQLSLTQEELANLVGATRESANRYLRDFEKKNWLNARRCLITLKNIDALQSFADV